MGIFVDRTNQRYGRLLVLERGENRPTPNNKTLTRWWCLCDCGTKKLIDTSSLISGLTQSCGCLHKERTSQVFKGRTDGRRPPEQTFLTHVIGYYKNNAKRSNREFLLTRAECEELIKANCFYCGASPTVGKAAANLYRRDRERRQLPPDEAFAQAKELPKNGIDRVDSTKGYTLDNCVTSCKTCNYAKLQLTNDEFKTWVRQIYAHWGQYD